MSTTAMLQASLNLVPTYVADESAIYHNVPLTHPDLPPMVSDGGDNTFIARLRGTRNGVLVSGFGYLDDHHRYFRKVVLSFEPLKVVH